MLGHVTHIGMASWMLAALSVVAAMAQTSQIDLGVPTPQRTQIPASGGALPQLDLFTSFVNISMTATELEVGGKDPSAAVLARFMIWTGPQP